MSAYKQRTSYHHHRQRDDHSSGPRNENLAQERGPTAHTSAVGQPPTTTVVSTSASTMTSSSAFTTQRDIHPSFATTATSLPHHLHLHGNAASSGLFQNVSHGGSSYHTAAEDDQHRQQQEILLESNPADLEWTPIRNSTSVARAKQRQQQYRERQQERTREWQSLLNQHYRPAVPTTASSQQPHGSSCSSWAATALADNAPRQGSAGVGNFLHPVNHDGDGNTHDDGRSIGGEQCASGKSQREESLLPPGDAYHEIIPGLGLGAVSTLFLHPGSSTGATSSRVMVPTTPSAATEEQLSSGFSDLMTSDGLESLGGESEDLGVWSQADDEADDDKNDEGDVLSFTLSTPSPILQRHRFSNAASPSVPMVNSGTAASSSRRPTIPARSRSNSCATSISQLPRPSFATASPTPNTRPHPSRPLGTHTPTSSSFSEGLHNQMPQHDGSGNFVDLMEGQQQQQQGYRSSSQTIDLLSDLDDSSLDLDLDWESSSSQESSLLRAYQQPLSASFALRRRISSSEFKTVIQNIADLQHQSALLPHQSLNPPGSHSGQSSNSSNSSHNAGHQSILSSPLSLSRLHRRSSQSSHPGHSQDSSRPRFTNLYSGSKRPIFNIYEDEMEDMADMIYEMSAKLGWMEAFQAALIALEPSELTPFSLERHPIKVLTALSTDAYRSESHWVPKEQHAPIADLNKDISDPVAEDHGSRRETLQRIRENMNAATMEATQRLQKNGRRRAMGRPAASLGRARHHYRGTSFDPMQVDFSPAVRTQEQDSSSRDQHGHGGLTTQSIGTSTSQSMLDSNLWAVVLSTLRRFRNRVQSNFLFDAYENEDLGAQWTSPSTSRARLTRENLAHLRSGRTTRSSSSSISSYSNRGSHGIRRVNSDCGMESLRDHLYSHSTYPYRQLEPQLVE